MDAKELSPQESLSLISQVIQDAKTRFEEDGKLYVLWGALIAVIAFVQFFLLLNERYDINYYPYFVIPIGVLISRRYYKKKGEVSNNQISRNIGLLWLVISLNSMVFGFGFSMVLAESLVPVILVIVGIGITLSGVFIKSKLILYAGLLQNLVGFICFAFDWLYHPLVLGISSILFTLIPGIILMNRYKKQDV
ncbi:MAG: hypothetical protein AAGD28_00430 [Bacteroidota bacterium]